MTNNASSVAMIMPAYARYAGSIVCVSLGLQHGKRCACHCANHCGEHCASPLGLIIADQCYCPLHRRMFRCAFRLVAYWLASEVRVAMSGIDTVLRELVRRMPTITLRELGE